MASLNWADLRQAASDAGFNFTVLPKGVYGAEVVKAEAKRTSSGDKDKITVRFKVIDGEHTGATVFNDFTISPESPQGLGFFFKHMNALGLDGDYFDAQPTFDPASIAADLEGRQCMIAVIVEPYQGEDKNKVKDVKPYHPGSGVTSSTPMPGNDVFAAPAPAPAPAPQDTPAPPPLPSF